MQGRAKEGESTEEKMDEEKVYAGVDVAKDSMDIAIHVSGEHPHRKGKWYQTATRMAGQEFRCFLCRKSRGYNS